MEPNEAAMTDFKNRFRFKLILGKVPITKIEPVFNGFQVKVMMTPEVSLDIVVPPTSDVKVGDLLTIYTEVLAEEKPDAEALKPSIQ